MNQWLHALDEHPWQLDPHGRWSASTLRGTMFGGSVLVWLEPA